MFNLSRCFFVFIIILIFSSCATSLKVNSINCPDGLELFKLDRKEKGVKSFSQRKMGIGNLTYSLKELFEREGISCANVSKVTFDIMQTPLDVLYSFLPSFTSKTIIIYYK